MLVAWSGMRGVVSLAAALAVPLTLADGTAFPHRNLILFITFVVILSTLVLQGLSLPSLIRALGIEEPEDDKAAQLQRRLNARMAAAALRHIDAHYAEEVSRSKAFLRLRSSFEQQTREHETENDLQEQDPALRSAFKKAMIEVVHVRRALLKGVRCDTELDLELVREAEDTLDLEEARIHRMVW